MSNIDKIRQEIERRIKSCDATSKTPNQLLWTELSALLPFLDALEDSECPEYCVRSHCIGCSKYNPDEWSNKPRKAKIKATGEILEGFTDGQGHFDVFTDHNVCSRYDVSAVEFDALSEEPDKDLEEAAETHVKNKYGLTRLLGAEMKEAADDFKSGANWQKDKDTRDMYMSDNRYFEKIYELGKKDMKEQMMKEAVEGEICHDRAGVDYLDYDIARLDKYIFSRFKFGDKVRIIILPKEDGQ